METEEGEASGRVQVVDDLGVQSSPDYPILSSVDGSSTCGKGSNMRIHQGPSISPVEQSMAVKEVELVHRVAEVSCDNQKNRDFVRGGYYQGVEVEEGILVERGVVEDCNMGWLRELVR